MTDGSAKLSLPRATRWRVPPNTCPHAVVAPAMTGDAALYRHSSPPDDPAGSTHGQDEPRKIDNGKSLTHVGSLPRTQEVVDFIFARENESALRSRPPLTQCMAEAVFRNRPPYRWRQAWIVCQRRRDLRKSATPPMSKIATPASTATARAMRPPILTLFPTFLETSGR